MFHPGLNAPPAKRTLTKFARSFARRAQQKSFDGMAAYYAETVNVSGSEGRPVRYLGAYVNALSDEGAEGVRRAYPAHKMARLVAVKDAYDPDNAFHLNQNILPS